MEKLLDDTRWIVILATTLIVFIKTLLYIREHSKWKNSSRIPTPIADLWPIIGHLRFSFTQSKILFSLIDKFPSWLREFGPIVRLSQGRQKLLITSDTELLHGIYSRHFDSFNVRHMPNEKSSKVNIFALNGAKWKVHRQLASQAFSDFSSILPILFNSAAVMVSSIKEKVLESKISHNQSPVKNGQCYVDIMPQLKLYTWNVLARLSVEHCSNGKEESVVKINPEQIARFSEVAAEIFERESHRLTYQRECASNAAAFFLEQCFPSLVYHLKRFTSFASIIYKHFQHCFRRQIETPKNPFKVLCDVISKEVNAQHSTDENREIDSSPKKESRRLTLSDALYYDLTSSVGFFAVETTLACVCRLLAENPMAQKHVKEEVKELFDFVEKRLEEQDNIKETEVLQSVLLNLSTFGTMDIPQLRYIEAVIKETLRLLPLEAQYSSATDRMCTQEIALSFGSSSTRQAHPAGTEKLRKVLIEEGTVIKPDVLTLCRDPDVWGSDPNEFRPERWLNENDGKQLQRRRAWMAFGVGRRRCVAERLSMLQLKIALMFIFRDNISLDLPSNAEVHADAWGICNAYSHWRPTALQLSVELGL